MSLSHSALRHAAVMVCAAAASAVLAPAAHALTTLQDQQLRATLPAVATVTTTVTRDSPAPVYPSTCPKFNVVVARGTDQAANQDEALDGIPYWSGSVFRSGPTQPSGVWWRIASELYFPENTTDKKLNLTTQPTSPELLRTDLIYPATTYFPGSTPAGTANLIRYLNRMVEANHCPNTKYVLLGYSQGALVIGDALSPPSKRRMWISGADALTTEATNAIVAVGLVANPAFNPQFLARNPGDYIAANLITSGYKIGTYIDTNKGMNDGNFNPAFSGSLQRDVTAYPVRTLPNPLYPGTVAGDYTVNAGLTSGDVAPKIRDYCKSRDYVCQTNNNASSPLYHEAYKTETTHRKNIAVFALEKLKPLVP